MAESGYTHLGAAAGGAGDLDGDGMEDFYIAAMMHRSDRSASRAGRIDVFRGLRSGYRAGETFPADGLVCVPGDVSLPALAKNQRQSFARAVQASADAERSLADTTRAARRTMWLGTGAAGMLAGTAGWLWRSRRRARRDATQRERERLARDLHDGLGSTVHRLQRLTELLKQAAPASAEAGKYRDELLQTSQELGGSMSDAIWLAKPENDTLESLIGHLANYAPSLLRPHGIAGELDLPAQLPPLPLTGETRQHLFLAVKEALTNVAKHPRARQAWLQVAWHEPWLDISVEDDGDGMVGSGSPRPGSGNGLKNLSHRMQTLGGRFEVSPRIPAGTRLTLRALFSSRLESTSAVLARIFALLISAPCVFYRRQN